MMKPFWILWTLLLLVGAWKWTSDRKQIQHFRSELEAQQAILVERQQWKETMEKRPYPSVTLEDLESVRQATADLMKLRAEYTQLKQAQAWSPADLKETLSAIQEETQALEAKTDWISGMQEASETSGQIKGMFYAFEEVLQALADMKVPPRNLSEARQYIHASDRFSDSEKAFLNNPFTYFAGEGETSQNPPPIPLEACEILVREVDGQGVPRMLLLREKHPRNLPDDQRMRIYYGPGFGAAEFIAPSEAFSKKEADMLTGLPHSLF